MNEEQQIAYYADSEKMQRIP